MGSTAVVNLASLSKSLKMIPHSSSSIFTLMDLRSAMLEEISPESRSFRMSNFRFWLVWMFHVARFLLFQMGGFLFSRNFVARYLTFYVNSIQGFSRLSHRYRSSASYDLISGPFQVERFSFCPWNPKEKLPTSIPCPVRSKQRQAVTYVSACFSCTSYSNARFSPVNWYEKSPENNQELLFWLLCLLAPFHLPPACGFLSPWLSDLCLRMIG